MSDLQLQEKTMCDPNGHSKQTVHKCVQKKDQHIVFQAWPVVFYKTQFTRDFLIKIEIALLRLFTTLQLSRGLAEIEILSVSFSKKSCFFYELV